MLPTTMIFTHLPRVLTIMTVKDLDLTSVDTLKQSVGAFIDEKKKTYEMVPAPPILPFLNIVYLDDEENTIENLEKQVPPADKINLPDADLNEIIPNATASLGYIKPGDYKDALIPKLQTTVFTVRLYKTNIDAKNYLSDRDKKAVNDCDVCDTLKKSKEYYKGKWLERVNTLYDEFHKAIIPVYEQWDAFAKDVSNWVDGVSEVEKVAFKEFNMELVLSVFRKRENFLAYTFQALAELIDARVNVLTKDKVPTLVTATGVTGKDPATKDKDPETKDKGETKEGMSKSTIALIVIIVVAVILIAGMVCFYLYKTKVQKHNAQTAEENIEV